jgi:hypothetical protein
MAVVAFTGNGVTPNTAGKNFVNGKTYAGSSRAALLPQWSAPIDPFKARIDALRKMEADATAEIRAKKIADAKQANQNRMLNSNPNNFPKSYPSNQDEYTSRGISSEAVLDPNGNVVGYTPTGNMPSFPPSSGASADAIARANGENVVDALSGNVLQDESFRNQLGIVRSQIYGAPKQEILPNGEQRLIYDNELLLYHGITSDMQASGYVAGRLPDPIDPNATDAEKYEYSKQGLFAPPLYKLGQEYMELATMTREEKINLQKNLKRAGYYSKTDTIVPGILQGNEIGYLQAAMGEANVAGLELSQLYELRSRARKKAIAAGGGGGGAPTRTVDINFNTTTMANGRVLLSRVLQDALGRAPSDEELAKFMAMLNNAESKSPTKTITQYVKTGKTRTSTSRTTPSEVDPEAMAREFASGVNGGNEMGSYQTNRLMSMLMNQVAGAANA